VKKTAMTAPLTILDHPILRRDLTILRNQNTTHGVFRKVIADISALLAYEALRSLRLQTIQVQTPLEETVGYEVAEEVVVVPVLRAGLGLVDGFTRFIPEARIGYLGMYRDEQTRQPVAYYDNLPQEITDGNVFLVDPMLATGGSAVASIDYLKKQGATRISFVCLVASPEGVKALQEHHPDVPIFIAALDRELNENAYICPGLGDAGDRMFGTGS
jgi:uracil phosphoribosyltransferase